MGLGGWTCAGFANCGSSALSRCDDLASLFLPGLLVLIALGAHWIAILGLLCSRLVFSPFFHRIRPASILHAILAFAIPTNLSIPPAPPQDLMKFAPTPSTRSHHHTQARQTCSLCTSFDVLLSLSYILSQCVVQIESTSHSSHTNQQLWQTLAVFICTVHDVYNLQLTYIN
jgi:hypothetical protein